MYGHNVFAILTPCDDQDKARTAFGLKQNADRFRKTAERIAEEPIIGSREPTPAPLSPSEEDHDATGCIVLTLDELPEDPQNGWWFGTRDPSDIFLGCRGTAGISSQQYNITIDEEFFVWLHDYRSSYGTAVSYNHQKKDEVRKKDTWILSYEPGVLRRWDDLRIYSGGLAIKIEFPNHEAAHPQYIENLRKFVERSKAALPPVHALGLDSHPPTAVPSQPWTPNPRPIYLDDGLIGRGQFSDVHRVIKTRDGKFYAAKKFHVAKEFSPPPGDLNPGGKRKRDEDFHGNWLEKIRNEIAIMQDNPHPNVMQMIDFQDSPEHLLLMPYYPAGNLGDLQNVSGEQYVNAFRQILLGLSHLHGRGVAHRDLKPENFLVELDPFTIIIADFGLSKIATDNLLTTFCGTLKYAAPEIFPGISDGYRPSVDIWSTGVIVLEWIYGLPNIPKMQRNSGTAALQRWSQTWSQRLLQKLHDSATADDKVADVLLVMIEIDPEERFSIDECLMRGCDNGLFKVTRDGRIVGAEDSELNTPENTLSHADSADDGIKTPTLRPPQWTGAGLSDTSVVSGDRRGVVDGGRGELRNVLFNVQGSIPGPSMPRRLRMSTPNRTDWSLTIGPSNSDSDGGFDLDPGSRQDGGPVTGLFIRRDHFTSSLETRQSGEQGVTEE